MKNFKFDFKFIICDYWDRYKKIYLLCVLFFIVGIIFGVVSAVNSNVNIISVSIHKYYVIDKQIAVFVVVLRRLFVCLFCFAICFFCGFHWCGIFVQLLLVSLRGYYFAYILIELVRVFGFGGFICLVFAFLPQQVSFMISLFVVVGCSVYECLERKKYGTRCEFKLQITRLGICFAICVVGILIEALLIALFVNPLI